MPLATHDILENAQLAQHWSAFKSVSYYMLNMNWQSQTTIKAPYIKCYTLEMYLRTGTDHLYSQIGTKDTPEFEQAKRDRDY